LAVVNFPAGGAGGYIDRNGNVVIEFNSNDLGMPFNGMPFSDGLAAVQTDRGWGFINRNGDWAIQPQFYEARSFSNGFAAVSAWRYGSYLWGFIDTSGNWLMYPSFRSALDFSEGMAAVGVESELDYIMYSWGFISAINGQTAATPALPPTDAPSSWAASYVTNAITAGLVPQNLQSRYTQATTRAEFTALAVAVYERVRGEITGRVTFVDTNDVNAQKMAYIGVVTGVGNNRFDPNGALTREQAAVMLSRLSDTIGQPFPEQASTFADNNAASSWALESIGRVYAAELMGGTGNNMFSPKQQFTREQSIITFLRLYNMVR
jgi:hypothetical protein